MQRKAVDPKLIALLDAHEKAKADFAKQYSRFSRIARRMNKTMDRMKRLAKRIDTYQPAQAQKGTIAP